MAHRSVHQMRELIASLLMLAPGQFPSGLIINLLCGHIRSDKASYVLSYPQWLRKLKTMQPVAAIKPNNLDYAVEIIAAAATLSQSHI
ncbi:uncharacterized protein CLUP02_18406 [Colletotrichum lupini]|uniref:Uncharacterized protein n=1 Tax=Colletotrichum lupini TaxID=145971 RepID=A0A9Q8SGD3_9PEZI|nr:uncharacterized protein CLUP02_18406 [Colletotrichum lupini]UQC76891.1 hypothetical protein CLUP02_18406 [Colletotrichum lupini]